MHDILVAGRRDLEEVTGGPLGWSPGGVEDLGRTAMKDDPSPGVDRVVERGANDRVEELDRVCLTGPGQRRLHDSCRVSPPGARRAARG